MKNKKPKKLKARDEVMLLHLTKTFGCGRHKSIKDYNRQKAKLETKNIPLDKS